MIVPVTEAEFEIQPLVFEDVQGLLDDVVRYGPDKPQLRVFELVVVPLHLVSVGHAAGAAVDRRLVENALPRVPILHLCAPACQPQ